MSIVIHDKYDAPAHAGLLQTPQYSVERYDGGKHSGKLIVDLKRHGHDERRPVFRAEVESQPGNNVPVVKDVEAIVVLNPMFAREVLELSKGSDIAEEEGKHPTDAMLDIAVAGGLKVDFRSGLPTSGDPDKVGAVLMKVHGGSPGTVVDVLS